MSESDNFGFRTDFSEPFIISFIFLNQYTNCERTFIYREDVLNAYLFTHMEQLRVLSQKWKEEYNTGHPHQSLGGKSLVEFKYARRKIIEAYEMVKTKMNDVPAHKAKLTLALTKSPSSIDSTSRRKYKNQACSEKEKVPDFSTYSCS